MILSKRRSLKPGVCLKPRETRSSHKRKLTHLSRSQKIICCNPGLLVWYFSIFTGSSTGNINEAGSEGGSGHIGFSPSHSSQSHRPSQLDVIKNSSKLAMREAQEKRNKQHEQLLSRQQHQFDQHQQQRNSDLPLEYFLQTVYVGDLNPGVTNPQLAQEFAPFGKVVEIRITPNVRSSSALVTFESSTSTKLAVDGMNDRQCCGGVVRVFPSRIPPNLRDHHDQYLAAMRQQQVNQTRSPMHQGQSPRHPPTTSPRNSVSNSPRHSVSNSPRHSVSNSPRHSVSNSPRHSISNSPRYSLTKSPHKGPHGAPLPKSNDAPKQPEHEVNKLPPQIAPGQHAATRGSWVDQDGAAAAAAGGTVENASEHDASRGIKEYADI
ncbi:hypothetical protein, variant [Sphaeroforma arctica JP610]|uniref:RRM domain-containing protein n=1 Tax=Sphaeroforma arctica JP610 TaxID=667725 RepID=A0A0L0GF76_9EUKA|nr:hypothetical protein, variant [Sphaeroforma arctica JP610]KNC87695.1 hypothetical protein, variant [Sphaeroforma arctica JP610]|eukprot:XP_014161597.1 hypothetical protein, variant [Sphaeroforma arctica JP610]